MEESNAPDPTRLSSALRRYLYFSAAVVGAAILVIEILGVRMLAPYFGTSHFVWTSQIAGTLLALALGYYAGGWLADRCPRASIIYWAIAVAGVYLIGTVLACEPVANGCLEFKSFALASLLASLVLFFIPMALLATAAPFFVRMVTHSVNTVGMSAGRLVAVGTFGSFAGSVLIGYVSIPILPNSWTMYLTAAVLIALALTYFAVWQRRAPTIAAASLLMSISAFGAYQNMQLKRFHYGGAERFYRNSNFGVLEVIESDGQLFYLNDSLQQNSYDPAAKKSASLFTYMLHGLARGYTREIANVLVVGLGAGIVPMEFAREGCRVDVVEINPATVPIAERWFDFNSAKVNIAIGDGREFLNRCRKKYDVVVVDAFLGESAPSHLMTREAFQAVHKILKPDGTIVMNTFGSLIPGDDFGTTSIYRTLAMVFPNVRIHTAGGTNVFFVAADHELRIVHPPDLDAVNEPLRSKIEAAWAGVIEPERSWGSLALHPETGRVLTDDFNPIDFYDAHNRERLRRSFVLKQKYRRRFQSPADE